MNARLVACNLEYMTFKRLGGALALLAFGATLGSCGKDEGNAGPGSADAVVSGLTLDSQITSQEQQELSSALQILQTIGIQGQNTRWFPEIFGGTSSSDVANYFGQRIHFFISSTTDMANRIFVNGERIQSEPLVPKDPRIGAFNWGAVVWLYAKAAEPDVVQFEVNNKVMGVPSSRVGLMQLGPGFGGIEPVAQSGILIHEARHSDCTGGLHASDLEAIRHGGLPSHNGCGHLHVVCPPGHDLAGLPGCDGDPWGAYTVQWVYSASIVLGCPSCTQSQQQVAMIEAIDSNSRLVFDVNKMVKGGFGPPDMSNSNQVVRN